VAEQRARVRGGSAHVVRPAQCVRIGRRPAQDHRVRRGRRPVARDSAARDHTGRQSPARRAAPGAHRRGRPRLPILHVPTQRLRVRAGSVVPRERGARCCFRGGRQAGGHARAGLGQGHQRLLPDGQRRQRQRRMGVGRQPAAGSAQLRPRPPQLPVLDADCRGGRLAKRGVDGRVQLRRVHRRQRRLHRSQDAVAAAKRWRG